VARRGRSLTPEDRRLWERVASTATPLRPDPAPAALVALPRRPEPAPMPEARRQPPDPPRAAPTPADPHAALERASPNMDRRRFDKLRRGRLEPEARLDLHGMTSEHAHAALTGFILDAHARDLRLVLVITGKGRADETAFQPRRHGILRHSLPHWLAAPPLGGRILQVASAHQRHGGAGAYYVYLRRRR
jgi:DNA-nicking Smr family endonuclease